MSAFYMLFYEKLKENIGNIRQDSDQLKSLDFKEWLFSRDADLYSYLLAANPVEQINKTNSLEGQNFRKIWNEWQNTTNYKLGASFHELHSNDMLEDDSSTLLLPYSILDYYYGSNGMCAGNFYIDNIIEKLEQLNIPYNLLPSTSLTRQCFAENYLSRKFYSNGEHVICDVAPKSSREKNYSLDKLPEMCITCSDFPLCGGIKPCDSEKCDGRYKKTETIAKVITYTKKKLI